MGKNYNWDNIILVGMPGSGKSTIATRLAKELGYEMVDGDRVIEAAHGKLLKDIIAECGTDGFLKVENETLTGLNTHHCVIAPGGSICYEPEAVAHFKEIGTIIYLQVDYPQLKRRLGDLAARGVVLKPGMTLKGLYEERTHLYEAQADIIVREGRGSAANTVETCLKHIRG